MRTLRIAALLVLTVPGTAYAEVMDKELSVFELWAWSMASGLAGLLGWPTFWPIAVLGALNGFWMFAFVLSELCSFDVGPAIIREAGEAYPVHAYAALVVFTLLHVAGLALFARRRKRAKPADAVCCR